MRTLFWRILVPGRSQRAVRRGDWKLLVDSDETQLLLFDLSKDVGERHDLAFAHPSIAKDLRGRIRAWEADVDAEAKGLQAK